MSFEFRKTYLSRLQDVLTVCMFCENYRDVCGIGPHRPTHIDSIKPCNVSGATAAVAAPALATLSIVPCVTDECRQNACGISRPLRPSGRH